MSIDNLKTTLNAIKHLLTGYPKKKDIPTKLPNPNPLTFTGAVTGDYDGSEPFTVEIPSGGGGGSTGGGLFKVTITGTADETGNSYTYVSDKTGKTSPRTTKVSLPPTSWILSCSIGRISRTKDNGKANG